MPSRGVELREVHGIRLRRAVLGILLSTGVPMTAAEVVAVLHAHGVTTPTPRSKGPVRYVGDMLAYQTRAGSARRVAPGRYVVIRSMSRTTRCRYANWHRFLDP